MPEERMVREYFTECAPIVENLAAMMDAAHDAFGRQQIRFIDDLPDRQEMLRNEIGSRAYRARVLAAQRKDEQKEPLIQLQGLLTHLHRLVDAVAGIAQPVRNQIRDGILFSEKGSTQVKELLTRHGKILRALAQLMREPDEGIRSRCHEECRELGQECLQFAEEHENRMVEGVCPPQAAPLFLAIIDHMQTAIRHESEMADLVGKRA